MWWWTETMWNEGTIIWENFDWQTNIATIRLNLSSHHKLLVTNTLQIQKLALTGLDAYKPYDIKSLFVRIIQSFDGDVCLSINNGQIFILSFHIDYCNFHRPINTRWNYSQYFYFFHWSLQDRKITKDAKRENYLEKNFENASLKIALIRVRLDSWRLRHAFPAFNQLWFHNEIFIQTWYRHGPFDMVKWNIHEIS